MAELLKDRKTAVALGCAALLLGCLVGYGGTWLARVHASAQQRAESLDDVRQEREQAQRFATTMRTVTDEQIARNRHLRQRAARMRHALSPIGVAEESPSEAFEVRRLRADRDRQRYHPLATEFVRWLYHDEREHGDATTFARLPHVLRHGRERTLLEKMFEQVQAEERRRPPRPNGENAENGTRHPQTRPGDERRPRDNDNDRNNGTEGPRVPFGPRDRE